MKESSPHSGPAITPAPPGPQVALEPAETLLRCLGQVVSNSSIYGPQHKATRQALDDAFAALGKIFTSQENVVLGVADERLHCGGHTVEAETALLRTLVRRFSATGVGAFGLKRGMTREEFERLMYLIGGATGGGADGFAGATQSGGFIHVSLKKVSYQAVAEDDHVVKKETATSGTEQTGNNKPDQASSAAVEAEIMTFLQSASAGAGTAISKEAEALASQPAQLAELLLRAADVRPEAANLADGEFLGNIIVGCLRRLHQKYSTAPSGKTQQGKKTLSRTLVMLEEEVVGKLRAMSGDVVADTAAAIISKEVEGLVEDLRVDALADDYLKKSRLIASTEQQLVKFIAARQGQTERADSLQELEKKLTDGGLDHAGWEMLLQKGATAGAPQGAAGGDAPPLAMLLMRLTDLLDPARQTEATDATREQVGSIVSELNQGVASAMAGVEQKVGNLREEIRTVQPLPEKAKPQDVELQARSRRHIITTLAEIVQELRQPLSVINGSIEMLCAGHLGLVPEIQREMLNLALQSSRRLGTIVDTLSVISGMPATLQPDAEVLDCIYHPSP